MVRSFIAVVAVLAVACSAPAPAATSAPTVAAATATAAPTAAPTATAAPSPTPAASPTADPRGIPAVPAPVAVALEAKTTALGVAVDGISGSLPFESNLTMWQLLNQPGFTNADNKPLAEKAVTLTRSDLVTFK